VHRRPRFKGTIDVIGRHKILGAVIDEIEGSRIERMDSITGNGRAGDSVEVDAAGSSRKDVIGRDE
jgi:hypothetical protein